MIIPKTLANKITAVVGVVAIVDGLYLAHVYFQGVQASANGPILPMEPSSGYGIMQLLITAAVGLYLIYLYKSAWKAGWLLNLSLAYFLITLIFQSLMNAGWRGF